VTLRHYSFSKWLALAAILQWFVGNGLIAAMAVVLGPAMAGSLKAALNVVGVLNVVYITMQNLLPLRLAQEIGRLGTDALAPYVRKVGSLLFLPVLSILLLVGSNAGWLVSLLYGTRANTGQITIFTQWLCAQYVLVFALTILDIVTRVLERTHLLLWNTVIGAAASCLYYPILRSYGMWGGMLCLSLITTAQITFLASCIALRLKPWNFAHASES